MWARLDDRFLEHRKLRAAGRDAALLYLGGILHCAKHLTDGHILEEELPLVAASAWVPEGALPALIARLERPIPAQPDALLWERVEGGYRVHDYLDYNPSAADVKEDRAAARERMRRARRRGSGEPSPEPDGNSEGTSGSVQPPRTRPVSVPTPVSVPSRPADGTGEVDRIISILTAPGDEATRLLVEKAVADHPGVDPVDVALDYLRWRDRGGSHGDPIKGWHLAMAGATSRGLYRRPVPPDEPDRPADLTPTGIDPWDAACRYLRATLGPDNFRQWFAPLVPISLQDDVLTLRVPDPVHHAWLTSNFDHCLPRALAASGYAAVAPHYVVTED